MIFENYSKHYDFLYRDKDYESEADYVHSLILKYSPDAKTILDLGCGTGKHDFYLAQKGYKITGIDISEEMITIAQSALPSPESEFEPPTFLKDDIRNILLDKRFDVIISLFHVMSYQVSNDDVIATLETASKHIDQRGVFIFDCWYGPGVFKDPPVERTKEIEDENISIIRVAAPSFHPHDNIVDVNYNVQIFNKLSKRVNQFQECHRMRYFFKPEIELFFKWTDFELLDFVEFMKNTPPDEGKWNACFVCRKIESPSGSSNIK